MRWILLTAYFKATAFLHVCFSSVKVATFLSSGAALQVSVGTVVAAVAGSPLSLQQLVHPLDDALQGLVHVQPHLLLNGQHRVRGEPLSRTVSEVVC